MKICLHISNLIFSWISEDFWGPKKASTPKLVTPRVRVVTWNFFGFWQKCHKWITKLSQKLEVQSWLTTLNKLMINSGNQLINKTRCDQREINAEKVLTNFYYVMDIRIVLSREQRKIILEKWKNKLPKITFPTIIRFTSTSEEVSVKTVLYSV